MVTATATVMVMAMAMEILRSKGQRIDKRKTLK